MKRLGLALGLIIFATGAEAKVEGARSIACPGGTNSWLVPFETAPFPYEGQIPDKGAFFDKQEGERRGHTSPRGGVYWEQPTYSDNRVLISVPKHFDPTKPAAILVFLHGNQATLERDVCRGQGVPRQVAASGANVVLVAPQLAVNALDSSAGKFWERGAFAKFLGEAADHLSRFAGGADYRQMDVIVSAYSGGYLPAVFGLSQGGASDRVKGLLLLDALYGEVDRFAGVISRHHAQMAVVSAYSASSKGENARLRSLLAQRGVEIGEGVPPAIRTGTVTFVPSPADVTHAGFMTRAFTADPLKALLGRLDGYRSSRTR